MIASKSCIVHINGHFEPPKVASGQSTGIIGEPRGELKAPSGSIVQGS